MNQLIFVYGTLKNGQYFHDEYLGNDQSQFIGPAKTSNEYTLYVDAHAHMVKEPSENGVKGELYRVNNDTLKKIDNLEGHPTVYRREVINVIDKDGNSVLAWGYLRPRHFKGYQYASKEECFI